VECDVTDDAQIANLATTAGPFGSLVITAGLSPQMASGSDIYRVNLIGTAKVLDAFEPAVVPGSVAVCFASIAGHAGVPPQPVLDVLDAPLAPDLFARLTEQGVDVDHSPSAYIGSKVGILRLVRRLAPPWGARGGRILSLSPGVVDTAMGRGAVNAMSHLDAAIAGWPIPRLGRPEEIASVVAFLCSEGASYMTGSDVLVDGGSVGWTP
jgi:NAD(P)-dependent dehydrogenase (short-subunit alcohol dehydrogenase family)